MAPQQLTHLVKAVTNEVKQESAPPFNQEIHDKAQWQVELQNWQAKQQGKELRDKILTLSCQQPVLGLNPLYI